MPVCNEIGQALTFEKKNLSQDRAYTVECPPGCAARSGPVFGAGTLDNPFMDASSICGAALAQARIFNCPRVSFVCVCVCVCVCVHACIHTYMCVCENVRMYIAYTHTSLTCTGVPQGIARDDAPTILTLKVVAPVREYKGVTQPPSPLYQGSALSALKALESKEEARSGGGGSEAHITQTLDFEWHEWERAQDPTEAQKLRGPRFRCCKGEGLHGTSRLGVCVCLLPTLLPTAWHFATRCVCVCLCVFLCRWMCVFRVCLCVCMHVCVYACMERGVLHVCGCMCVRD